MAASMYGECTQTCVKSPYKSKRSRLPRLGELSAEQTEGSYLDRQAPMRLIDEKVLVLSVSIGKCGPPRSAGRWRKAPEGMSSRYKSKMSKKGTRVGFAARYK